MIRSAAKIAAGILLLPFAVSVSMAASYQIKSAAGFSREGIYFLYGVGAYFLFHIFIWKPSWVYVLGHELAHVLAVWICGGRVKSFRIHRRGGEVYTTKDNVFISLAPYYFPTYTIVVSVIYFAGVLFMNFSFPRLVLFALLGITLAFHLVMTSEFIRIKQPDILKTGYIFSLITIYIVNILILGSVFSFFLPGSSFASFVEKLLYLTRNNYTAVFHQLFF